MYQVQKCLKLTASFPSLQARDKHNYNTRSAMQNILDIPLTKTSIYGTKSVKYHCIRGCNLLGKNFRQVPENELSHSNIKSYLKHKCFDQY